jgi:hypothetical protein
MKTAPDNAVVRMTLDLIEGVRNACEHFENPTWELVRGALLRLDGRRHTLVTIHLSAETHMGVGGGPDRFVVYVTRGEESSHNLVDPTDTAMQPVSLNAGGQVAEYPARQCVTKEGMLRAARAFAQSGQPSSDLTWERAW